MQILLSMVILFAPIWVPMCITGLYAFVVRKNLPKSYLSISDKLYYLLYFGLWLVACVLFVVEIWGWQMSLTKRWLWLLGLGLPTLVAMVGIMYISIMATDAWDSY